MKKINKELFNILKTLDNLNKDYENNRLRIFSSNRIHLSKFTFFRYICENKKLHEYSYRDIFINYFNKAENFYPGSSYFLSKEIVSLFFYENSFFENKKFEIKSKDNLFKLISQNISKENLSFFKNILHFSGPDATLICKSSNNYYPTVIKKNSSTFNVSIHEDFINIYFNNVKESTKGFQTCVLDAYIERESELMPLLDSANINKRPVLIFCRGISNNAVRALKSIIVRNNIFVYPYIVKFNNEDPFILKDISSALNIDFLSSETGDSIYKDIVNKSAVREIKVKPSSIEIKKPCIKEVSTINKKLSECHDDNLKKYLLKRKSRFISNIVEINIPKTKIEMLNEIKNSIICYNHFAAFGSYRIENKLYSRSCIDYILKLSNNMEYNLKNIGYAINIKNSEVS